MFFSTVNACCGYKSSHVSNCKLLITLLFLVLKSKVHGVLSIVIAAFVLGFSAFDQYVIQTIL